MKYKSDKFRIQDALIPCLYSWLFGAIIDSKAEVKGVEDLLRRCITLRQLPFIDLATKDRNRLVRRCERDIRVIADYIQKNKWCVAKSLILVTYWAESLREAGGIELHDDTLLIMDWCFNEFDAFLEIEDENFEALEISASKQVPKIHKLFLDLGYFQ